MVTIKEIADKLGISISTVSKGLNGASDISDQTRQQVLNTALELGYILKRKKSSSRHHVCIIIENTDYNNINQSSYEIISGFRMAAAEHLYDVSVIPINILIQSNQDYDSYSSQNGYNGVFFLNTDSNYIKQLQNTYIPTVLLDKYVSNKNVSCIGMDNNSGTHSIINYLYQNGHRNISFISGPRTNVVADLRYQAFLNSMSELNLEIKTEFIGFGPFSPETGKKFAKTFAESGATAIICGNDLIASGAINELYKLGKKVPDEISVTGFDDLPVSKYIAPPLTTIKQDRLTIGKAAFFLLHNHISDIHISTLLVNPELIIRESVKNIFIDNSQPMH